MNDTVRHVLAVILTFVISRAGYKLLGFNPMEYFSGVTGYAVDIAIWLVICFAILWIFKKLFKTKLAKS